LFEVGLEETGDSGALDVEAVGSRGKADAEKGDDGDIFPPDLKGFRPIR
jgi:hypothetical protein